MRGLGGPWEEEKENCEGNGLWGMFQQVVVSSRGSKAIENVWLRLILGYR